MTCAIAIFAKTPGLSPVKTRLATAIGAERAEQFYRHSVACLEELARHVMRDTRGDIVASWAVGEENGLDHPLWQNLDRLWTSPGGLGERLDHVYATLLEKHDHVILIGTDSPQLPPAPLLTAHRHLRKAQGHVLGPAEDGGYYLYGGHTPLPRDLWLATPYSVPETCAVFARNLAPHGDVHFLDSAFDVDTLTDLTKLRDAPMTRPAQNALRKWMEGVLT